MVVVFTEEFSRLWHDLFDARAILVYGIYILYKMYNNLQRLVGFGFCVSVIWDLVMFK